MLQIEKLVNLRKEKGLLQKELAKELGIERSTYVKYETAGIQPPNDIIVRIAEYFNVTTDYLLGLSDDPIPPDAKKIGEKPIPEDYVVFTVNPKGGRQETRMLPLKDFNEALAYAEFKKAQREQNN